MQIALTGASGFIGSAVAGALAAAGHDVVALVRASSLREHIESVVSRFVVGDQGDPTIWRELIEDCEGLVHNSFDWEALRSGDLRRHLETNVSRSVELLFMACERGVRRVAHVSSVSAQHHILERSGGVIDEDHPNRPGGRYGAAKAAVEAHLWWLRTEFGVRGSIVRPAAVYGIEPELRRSHGYGQVERLMKGERVTPSTHPGGGKFVHIEDVATAIAQATVRDAADGRIFNLADCYAKHTRLGVHAAEALGVPASMVEEDTGPPAKNVFDKVAAREVLGVEMSRGDAGLRAHMFDLVERMRA